MIELDKKDMEAIANSRFMRKNGVYMWSSFGVIVAGMIFAGAVLQPGPGWTATTITFVSIVAICAIAWSTYWIRKQARATKELIAQYSVNKEE